MSPFPHDSYIATFWYNPIHSCQQVINWICTLHWGTLFFFLSFFLSFLTIYFPSQRPERDQAFSDQCVVVSWRGKETGCCLLHPRVPESKCWHKSRLLHMGYWWAKSVLSSPILVFLNWDICKQVKDLFFFFSYFIVSKRVLNGSWLIIEI